MGISNEMQLCPFFYFAYFTGINTRTTNTAAIQIPTPNIPPGFDIRLLLYQLVN